MKKMCLLLLLSAICLTLLACGGSDYIYKDGVNYVIENKELTITGIDADVEELLIPDKVKGYNVTKIGDAAFLNSSLKSVTLGENIITVSRLSFSECDALEEVILNDNLEVIGQFAFNKCSRLDRITIKENVKEIDGNPFIGCDSLGEIEVIGNEYYKSIEGVLFSSNNECLIAYPIRRATPEFTYTIPAGTKNIGDYAFAGTPYISNIILNDGLESIGKSAFSECLFLKSVLINDSLIEIEQKAFYKCISLEEIDLANVEIIGEEAFYSSGLTNIVFGDKLKTIKTGAFAITKVVNVNILSVTSIGDKAFMYCPNLVSITIPNTINVVGADFVSYGSSFKLESIFTSSDYVDYLKEMLPSDLQKIVKVSQ